MASKWVNDNPIVVSMLWKEKELAENNSFFRDLLNKSAQYGKLSEKQASWVVSLTIKHHIKKAEQAKRVEAARASGAVEVPTGRRSVVGKVVKTQHKEDQDRWVMIVESEEGFKVWGSVPKALMEQEEGTMTSYGYVRAFKPSIDVDDEIQFEATLVQSDTDPFFGFFSRPTKARVLVQKETV